MREQARELKRINKKKARRLYNEGKTIYITRCKVSVFSELFPPFILEKKNYHSEYPELIPTFDNIINEFEYYNCCPELGYYAAYYIEED